MTTPRTRLPFPTQRRLLRGDHAAAVEALRGRRAILASEEGSLYGWVVWSETLQDLDGFPALDVVPEEAWWRWIHTSRPPAVVTRWPAAAVAVEEVL